MKGERLTLFPCQAEWRDWRGASCQRRTEEDSWTAGGTEGQDGVFEA